MPRNDHAFTLLEIMLAVVIGLMIIAVAIPSLDGLMDEHKARASFEAFDKIVMEGQALSVENGLPVQLRWEDDRIVLVSMGEDEELSVLPIDEKESFTVEFPAALIEDPPARWTFWPTGTCEPATIRYAGPKGRWIAVYDPLTGEADYSYDDI